MRTEAILGGVSVLAALFAVVSGPSHARDFRSADVYAADTPTVQAMRMMASLVEKQTGGRVRIESFGESDPESENFIVQKVRTGTLDMARVSLQVFNGSVPSTAVLSAPYLFRSNAQLRRALDGPVGAAILDDLAQQQGVVPLCFYDLGARSIITTGRPVRSAADLRGLKLRAQPGDLAAIYMKDLGAEPTPLPFAQITSSMKANAIDAAMVNWMGFISGKQYNVARIYSLTEHSRVPGVVIVSEQAWKSLSPADQAALKAAAKESAGALRDNLALYEVQARRTAEIAGVKMVDDIQMKSFIEPLTALYPTLLPAARQQELLKLIRESGDGS